VKFRFTVSLTLLLLLVQAHPAMAAWGSFVQMGSTTVNSDVSCATTTGGQAVCGASGFTNTLLMNQFNGSTWSGWTKLAGAISSTPSCANDGNGHVICAARASNGGMVATVFNGTAWSAEAKVMDHWRRPSVAPLSAAAASCVPRAARAVDSPPACSTELGGVLLTAIRQLRRQHRDAGATTPGASYA
jgi:hypothetical protein